MPRIEIYEGTQKIADIGLPEKKFSTGSVGYWASQKLEVNGKRYSVSSRWLRLGPGRRKSDSIHPLKLKALAGTEPVTFYRLPIIRYVAKETEQ